MKAIPWSCIAIAPLLGSCASTSPRFHTLVPLPERNPRVVVDAGLRLKVESVRVPAQVDRLEVVTRLPGGGVEIADGERWIAPVADELQSALTVELVRRIGHPDPGQFDGSKSASVRLFVERFEASVNRYALIEASWHLTLRATDGNFDIVCHTRAYEDVGVGYQELVRGYQHAVADIAVAITTVVQEAAARAAASCPGGVGST